MLKKQKKLILTEDHQEAMRRAGRVNGQLRDFLRPHVQAGVTTLSIDNLAHQWTLDHGHKPATLGYQNYPKSCCTSINDVICHGIPDTHPYVIKSKYHTYVPSGDWKTVHSGAATFRMTLRRYVIMMFHETPMGPHRGRDSTVDSIQDAGVWWPTLYTDVSAYVRSCLICASTKALVKSEVITC